MRILLVHGHAAVTAPQLVGALADLGVSPSTFEWELSKVDVGDCHLHFDQPDPCAHGGVAFSIHGGASHREGRQEDDHAHSASGLEHPGGSHHLPSAPVPLHASETDHAPWSAQSEPHPPGETTGPHGRHRVNLGELRQRVTDSELSTFAKELTLRLLGYMPGGLPAGRGRADAPLSGAELELLACAVLIAVGIEQLKVTAVQMLGEYSGSRDVAAASPHADRPFEMDPLVRALHDALPASSSLEGIKLSRRGTGLGVGPTENAMPRLEVSLLEV